MKPVEVKRLRQGLDLTQQQFASLLGLSFVSINKWENGGSEPTGLSAVLLQLLESALMHEKPHTVIAELRASSGQPVDVVRTLTALERKHVRQSR